MLSRRSFVATGLLAMASLAGGCVIGGGSGASPEVDFTIKNLTGSPVVLRFDLGLQSSTRAEIIERITGVDIPVASGQSTGYSTSLSKIQELRQKATQNSATVVWQIEVRQLGASWEEPRIRWFEVRDTLPIELTIVTGIEDESGERTVQMRAKGGTVTPIPPEYWPTGTSD